MEFLHQVLVAARYVFAALLLFGPLSGHANSLTFSLEVPLAFDLNANLSAPPPLPRSNVRNQSGTQIALGSFAPDGSVVGGDAVLMIFLKHTDTLIQSVSVVADPLISVSAANPIDSGVILSGTSVAAGQKWGFFEFAIQFDPSGTLGDGGTFDVGLALLQYEGQSLLEAPGVAYTMEVFIGLTNTDNGVFFPVSTIGGAATYAQEDLVFIDFNDLTHGVDVLDQYDGVHFELNSLPGEGPVAYALKDGDPSNTGNPVTVLGIADGLAITPYNPAPGFRSNCLPCYDFTITFDTPINYFSMLALDAEEGFTATAYLGGTPVASVNQGNYLGFHNGSVFRGPVYEVKFGLVDGPNSFDKIVFDINNTGNPGPELFDNLRYGRLEPKVQPVNIDIKPGSDTNCTNINGHGVIPVATFGSADFNVEHIDQTTLSFAGLDVRKTKKGKLLCHLEDINIDGYWDLICQFEDDTEKWPPDSDTEATLTGNLLAVFDGSAFQGTDSICLVPKKHEAPEAPNKSPKTTKEDNLNPLPWW